MSGRFQLLVLLLWNWLGLQIVTEVNHYLSAFGIALHLDLLWLLFVALNLGRKVGLLYTVLFGLLAEAHLGGPDGIWISLYLVFWALLVTLRRHIQRDSALQMQFLSVFLQGLLFTLLSVFLAGGQADTFAYWQRILIEGALSLVAIWLLCVPWAALQYRLLQSLGCDIFADVRTD
ncbi:MAG: hypothetical protein Q7P63_11965 [Verrucomicrobiota bacterium JB022]|nr:hypothetical protein [Verrucomicrobiota bacterium JB022]